MKIKLFLLFTFLAFLILITVKFFFKNNQVIEYATTHSIEKNNNKKEKLTLSARDVNFIINSNKKIMELETRVSYLEKLAGQNYRELSSSKNDSTTNVENKKSITEIELANWIDEKLNSGYMDNNKTQIIFKLAEKSYKDKVELALIDLRCGEYYCRADFNNLNNKNVDQANIFGSSPFMGEGFLVNNKSNDVFKIYFTQVGYPLSKLEDDAINELKIGE